MTFDPKVDGGRPGDELGRLAMPVEELMGPRIRSIKPEISRSPDFTKLSNAGRVAFYALIGQADDAGRLQGFDAEHLAINYCAPGTSVEELGAQLDLMENLDMIRRYGGRTGLLFTQLCNWSAHQRVEKPSQSRIPAPPLAKRRRRVGEQSENIPASRARADRIGEDRKGSDRIGEDQPPIGSPAAEGGDLLLTAPISLSPVEQVFEPWRLMWHPAAKLTRERRSKISARLREGFSVEDLIEAETTGAANDPWELRHQNLNDDLTYLLKDGGAVERFLGFARSESKPSMPPRKPSMSRFYRDQAAELAKAGD